LIRPMIKRDGQWSECDWQVALEFTAHSLQAVKQKYGAKSIAALGSPHSTSEELYLLQKLIRAVGSGNVDHRLRQSDFRADKKMLGVPWLGTSIADISQLKSALIIGSTLRKDHPLIAQRLRQAVKNGLKLNIVNPMDDDLLIKVANKAIISPASMTKVLAEILKAAAEIKGTEPTNELKQLINSINASNTANAFAIASSLIENAPAAIYLGNLSQHHPDYSTISLLADLIAQITGAKYGVLGEAANSVGAYLAGAIPEIDSSSAVAKLGHIESGLNAAQMLGYNSDSTDTKCQAFILLNVEPEFDTYNSYQALKTIQSSEFVVSLSVYQGNAKDYADVLLPITPFTETSGTFVNTEGKVQSFNGVVSSLGEARPAWKVLRVLANLLGLEKFDYETPEQIREEIFPKGIEIDQYLNNKLKNNDTAITVNENLSVQRIGEVPIYQADPIVRRAESLQATHDATPPKAWMTSAMLEKLGIVPGDRVNIRQGEGLAQLEVAQDEKLPANCVRIAGAHPKTAALGALLGEIVLEKL